ncbi:MAG TPA: hypothetical protein VFZ00_28390 [Solirubrobacter sp.]|nr:hypothetical protein [Solirubrobacter sp.]
MKKLTTSQARALHDAEVAVKNIKAALEAAEAKRETLRVRYLELIPLSDDPEERAKGVRAITVGAFKIRVTPQVSGDFFRLSKYLAAGHKLTAQMREHVAPGRPFDRWTVNGPAKRSDAVETSR